MAYRRNRRSPSGVFGLLGSFFNDGGSTLLIKGAPGTGKTTLALTLALTLKPPVISYISTRVSEDHVEKQFPWIRKRLPETRIEDLRLGRAELLVEEIIDSVKEPNSMVIVDSWDSFANILPREEALKTEAALVHLASAPVGGAKVVFVSERVDLSPLDYVVDGVIQTEAELRDGRVIRRLKILKLRGVRVERPVSLFSIDGSRVVTARPDIRLPERFEAVAQPEDRYSLGVRDLDRVFGAPRFGEGVAYDLSPSLPFEFRVALTSAALASFLARGGGAVVVLRVTEPERVLGLAHVGGGVEGRLRLFTPARNVEGGFLRSIPDSVEEFEEKLQREISEVKAKSGIGRVLVVLSETVFAYKFANNDGGFYRSVYRLLADATVRGDAFIYIGASISQASERVYALIDKHIRMTVVDGTPLIYGVKPHTPYYFMDTRNGRLKLVELV